MIPFYLQSTHAANVIRDWLLVVFFTRKFVRKCKEQHLRELTCCSVDHEILRTPSVYYLVEDKWEFSPTILELIIPTRQIFLFFSIFFSFFAFGTVAKDHVIFQECGQSQQRFSICGCWPYMQVIESASFKLKCLDFGSTSSNWANTLKCAISSQCALNSLLGLATMERTQPWI